MKRKELERDLIAALQQRDRALAARDEAISQMKRAIADAAAARVKARPLHRRALDAISVWTDDLTQGLGL